jgi:hypothetical protein
MTSPMKRIPLRANVRTNFCSRPLSPSALRTALMRLSSVESETTRPLQTDVIRSITILDQIDQQIEYLRLNGDNPSATQLSAIVIEPKLLK